MRAAVFTKPYGLTPALPDSGQSGLPVNKLPTRKGYSTNVALKASRGYFNLIHRVTSPGVAEQPESVCIQWMRPERGRAVLSGFVYKVVSSGLRVKIILSSEEDAF